MSEILNNTGVKLWSETDYSELWLTVFDQLTGQGGKSNIRLIDEAIGKINAALDGYKFEFSSDEDRLYISKGDSKLPVSLIDSNGHVASKVDGTTITIDESGVVKGIPVDDALSEESTNPLQNKVIAGELKSIKSKMGTNESVIKQNTSDITSNTKRIEANETAISTLNGTGDGSVKKAVSDGIAEVVAGAPEDFDTLKEMSDWISTHETSASAMNSQIQDNKKAIDNHASNGDIHVTTENKTNWNKVSEKLDKTGDASNVTTEFTTATTRSNLTTKEKLSISFGKISKWFSDLKDVAFSGSYNDLNDKPASLPANGGNSTTVNGHTVNSDVPANAKFTDTTYGVATTTKTGIVKPDGSTITVDEDGTLHGVAKVTVDDTLSPTSTNPVQNKVVTSNLTDVRKETTVNLLKPTLETTTKNGVTCTNNGDGTYTLNGTATDGMFFDINTNISINKGTKYKVFSFKDGDYAPGKIMSGVRRIDTIDTYVMGNGSFVSDSEKCWLWLKIEKGITVSNLVCKPMLTTNLSATYEDFVPYTGDTGRLNGDVAELKAEVANNKTVVDATMSDTSTNPVQNKVITSNLKDIRKEITVNLLNPDLKSSEAEGIKCTANGDGTYTFNGTATRGITIQVQLISDIIKNHLNEDLLLVGCPKGGSDTTYKMHLDTDGFEETIDTGNGGKLNATQVGKWAGVSIVIAAGCQCNNLVFKPMLTTNINATYDDFVSYTGNTGKLNGDVVDLAKKIPKFERNSSIFASVYQNVSVVWANGPIGVTNDHWDDDTGRHITYKFPQTGAYTVCGFNLEIPAHAVLLCELYVEGGGATVEIREPLFFYNQGDTMRSKRVSCTITGRETDDEITVICNPIVIKNV